MSASEISGSELQWEVVHGHRSVGVFTHSQVSELAAAGKLPPGCALSCGGGWITLTRFISDYGVRIATGEGAEHPAPSVPARPPPLPPVRTSPAAAPVQQSPAPSLPAATPLPAPAILPSPSPAQAPPPPSPSSQVSTPSGVAPVATLEPELIDRDRIVVLGRRQSGKTIYLASVYAKLWRALDGLTAKALRGEVHKQLMDVGHVLRQGGWPASTLESRQMELELEDGGTKRLMVALDYAGEMFANAFLHERLDMPDVKALVDHIDRAAAVMLLVDPSIVAGMDHQAATEDDFGLVQAVQRIRNWPGGDDVPIVLVLTKVDQYQGLLDRFGGPDGFVRHHFPALVRLLKRIAIFQVSAVQVTRGADGKLSPRKDFTPINVDNPLRYCLRMIHQADEKVHAERAGQERRLLEARLRREELRREQRQNRILVVSIAGIILIGIVIVVMILVTGDH